MCVDTAGMPCVCRYCIMCVCSLQFLEGMSEKILKGIEEAQIDLSKEKQKKDEEVHVHVCQWAHISVFFLLFFTAAAMTCIVYTTLCGSPIHFLPRYQQQGFLHNIPVVGSLWSWFAPPTPTTPEGRSFNLKHGKTVIYIYIYIHTCIYLLLKGHNHTVCVDPITLGELRGLDQCHVYTFM